MTPEQIIFLIGSARSVLDGLLTHAALMRNNGEITDEQLADIKAKAEVSDAAWDSRVSAARSRLGQ